ncbi:MAG: hypothetical protein MK097_06920, partial [Dechloromonas sp.]|nr:hypothetical protein [Dechloromonas sp.]
LYGIAPSKDELLLVVVDRRLRRIGRSALEAMDSEMSPLDALRAYLINSAVVAVKGDTSKKDEMKAEMEKANFKSVRGDFKFNTNHYPVQNYVLRAIGKDAGGRITNRTMGTIFTNHADAYVGQCKMK